MAGRQGSKESNSLYLPMVTTSVKFGQNPIKTGEEWRFEKRNIGLDTNWTQSHLKTLYTMYFLRSWVPTYYPYLQDFAIYSHVKISKYHFLKLWQLPRKVSLCILPIVTNVCITSGWNPLKSVRAAEFWNLQTQAVLC